MHASVLRKLCRGLALKTEQAVHGGVLISALETAANFGRQLNHTNPQDLVESFLSSKHRV